MIRILVALLIVTLPAQGRLAPEALAKLPPPHQGSVDFKRDIAPIFEKSCASCHARGRDKGGFLMETRDGLLKGGDSGPAIVAGNSSGSLLIELVSGLDPDSVMPQKGTKLTPQQVGLLRAWIDQGAKWDPEISFAKKAPVNLRPRKPEIAGSKGNAIDAILGDASQGKLIGDRAFARRAYLDVIGLLPAPEELENFVSSRAKDKRAALVAELLARNNDYAQHWMTFWNDMLRNDYRGTGYIDGGRKQITSWLYSSLATNKPFDQFVAELINPTPQSEGFVKGIVWRGVVNASQTPEMQAAQNISQVFMGVNLKCASCHDSFINEWSLADAYGLASIYSEHPLEMVQCDKPLGKKALVKFIYPELGGIDAKAPKAERLKRLSEVITSPEDGRLSRTIVNRLWARFFGRGLVEPVDEMEQPAWNQDLLDWLAADLVEHKYDLKRTIQVMLTSRAYQLPSVPATEVAGKSFVFRGPLVRRLSAEQFLDALGSVTGVWNGDAVPDLAFVTGAKVDPAFQSSPANPRWIWNTKTAATAAAASTVQFSKTFNLSENATEARITLTCDNAFTLFVNGNKAGSGKDFTRPVTIDIRKHLKTGANEIKIDATNDQSQPGRTDVDQSNPAGFIAYVRLRTKAQTLDFASDSTWQNAVELGAASMGPWNLGEKLARAVANQDYAANCRAVLANADPLMTALGRPNREQVITTRASIATTLQALELTNGSTLSSRMRAGAENLAGESDPARIINQVYMSALGRKPTSKEAILAAEVVGGGARVEGVEDLLWAVTMLPEFQLIH